MARQRLEHPATDELAHSVFRYSTIARFSSAFMMGGEVNDASELQSLLPTYSYAMNCLK